MADNATIDRAVIDYISLRDKKKQLDDAHSERMVPLVKAMEKIEVFLSEKGRELGTDSFKASSGGTAFKSKKTRGGLESWDTFFAWCVENQQWHFLNRAVSKRAIEDYLAEHGELPPGTTWEEWEEWQVRRPK